MAISFTPFEKVLRAKVQLMKKEPFFGILVMQLRFEEVTEKRCPTMGIDNKDHVIFNPEWINILTEKELQSVLKHEIFHRVFTHHERSYNLLRKKGKKRAFSHMLANIAQDMCINELLARDRSFSLPDGCLAVSNDSCEFNGIVIKDISKRTWESIYDELEKKVTKESSSGDSTGFAGTDVIPPNNDGDDNNKSKEDDKDGESEGSTLSKARLDEELSEKWKGYLARAAAAAKQRGTLPAGMEAMVTDMLEPKVPWATKLRKAVTGILPFDQTWRRPSRRGISAGLYLPSMKKENVEVIVHVDTSGSTWEMCGEFFSECSWILNSVGNVKMTLILCDCTIQKVIELTRSDRWNDEWRIKAGGGGTSHMPVVKWLNENSKHCRLFISFTDGYSDIPESYAKIEPSLQSLIVLPASCKEMEERLVDHCSEVIIMN